MNPIYAKLVRCYNCVRKQIDFVPKIALVLGSGLGEYADKIQIEAILPYEEIEEFPVSTVSGHQGRFVFGYVNQIPIVIMQGRVHYYEGYDITDVVLPIRLMKMLGAEILILTNAAGGINHNFHPGDFMMITDQIGCFVPSPLIGQNMDELGSRFCDMSHIYDEELQEILRASAKAADVYLQEGVYIQFSGPAYESPAEIEMSRRMGADAVGMSTACEATAANHMGMKICGISCITNMACGILKQPLSHQEVKEAADKAAPKFEALLTEAITSMKMFL